MIPRAYIAEWRSVVPWQLNEQVEQDLLLSRALVEIFSDEFLATQLAFRGGTALHKLHFSPPARYSEDIDLVQLAAGPIGAVIDRLRAVLTPWLGEPRRKQANRNTTLVFRCESEIPPVVPLRLKIEINCREHFNAEGIRKIPYAVQSRLIVGKCELPTYTLEELLATKMRALYQRRKGRDLFDVWYALTHAEVDCRRIACGFAAYLEHDGLHVSGMDFEQNMEKKLRQHDFLHDTDALLCAKILYDPEEAWTCVRSRLVSLMA